MAIQEVSAAQRATAPYSAVGIMFVYWPDGTMASGTASVVGRNDVLTATHMVYSPDHGGYAKSFDFYFGADYNNVLHRFDSSTFSYAMKSGSYAWNVTAFTKQVFADGQNSLMSSAESQFDVALIGVDVALGDRTGWFTLDPEKNGTQSATQVGYPATGTGMLTSTLTVAHDSYWNVWSSTTDAMGPGSSGGPLISGDGTVIGVKSAGSANFSVWADVGTVAAALANAMTSNDALLGVAPAPAPAPSVAVAPAPVAVVTPTPAVAPAPAPGIVVPAPAPAPVPVPAPAPAPLVPTPEVSSAVGVYHAFFGVGPTANAYLEITGFLATSTPAAYATQMAQIFVSYSGDWLATRVLQDLGVSATTLGGTTPAASYTALHDAVAQLFSQQVADRGQIVLNMTQLLGGLGADAVYGGVATSFKSGVAADFVALSLVGVS